MRRTNRSQDAILTALAQAEGRRLRFGDLVKTTQLSQTTVSKVLKQLQKANKVERQVDGESEEYPPPVFYKNLENEEEIRKREVVTKITNDELQILWEKEGMFQIITCIRAINRLLDLIDLQPLLFRYIIGRYHGTPDYKKQIQKVLFHLHPPEFEGIKLAVIGFAQQLLRVFVRFPHLVGIEADPTIQPENEKEPPIDMAYVLSLDTDPDIQTIVESTLGRFDPDTPHKQLLYNIQAFSDRVWDVKTPRDFFSLGVIFQKKVAVPLLNKTLIEHLTLLRPTEDLTKGVTKIFLSSWINVDDPEERESIERFVTLFFPTDPE